MSLKYLYGGNILVMGDFNYPEYVNLIDFQKGSFIIQFINIITNNRILDCTVYNSYLHNNFSTASNFLNNKQKGYIGKIFQNSLRGNKEIRILLLQRNLMGNSLLRVSYSEAFAKYFSIPYGIPTLKSYDFPFLDVNENIVNTISITFPWNSFSITDVELALEEVKPKQTMGSDKIPSFNLRNCSIVLASPFAFLYKPYPQNCTFLEILMNSRVVRIHKKDNPNLIGNHRLMSVLYSFSKSFEVTLYVPIYNHVHLFTEKQDGFLKCRSTTHLFPLRSLLHQYLTSTCKIYTGFSKAFDNLGR